ncbi:MAG: M20/M25/M40 family metallo-hydrolase [Clostridia bacterium]|nr:M20/M25/M40 family metallo-hydrolase [Clostridia bacterium]
MKNSAFFRNENDYADFPQDAAVEHLSHALTYPTVSYVNTAAVDYTAFDRMQEYLRAAFPHIAACGKWEKVGYSLLITLPGTDKDLRPALFMAHQDVVPVVPGTESKWLHRPFSGDVADGCIWGRGAMDIKQMLIAELESAEYLLSHGHTFERTVYLAFGEDEETCSAGARAIAALLRERGITLEYVLDEGAGDVTDAGDWGAPGARICTIGMYEKGYGDLRLRVRSSGGHSSNPFYGTSLGWLSEAIAAILQHPPAARLSGSVKNSLEVLSPMITEEPIRTWAKDAEKHEEEILGWFLRHESLYHLVRTTVAPTMISGGAPAGNVMPQDMEAVINFRMIPEDTPEGLIREYRKLLGDKVQLDWVQQISASVPSDIGAYGYGCLKTVLEHYFDRLIFIPVQNRGATDARYYESICRCVMRFGPFLEEEDVSAEGVHGTNERISVRAYLQGIRVLIRLMEQTCAKGIPADE